MCLAWACMTTANWSVFKNELLAICKIEDMGKKSSYIITVAVALGKNWKTRRLSLFNYSPNICVTKEGLPVDGKSEKCWISQDILFDPSFYNSSMWIFSYQHFSGTCCCSFVKPFINTVKRRSCLSRISYQGEETRDFLLQKYIS